MIHPSYVELMQVVNNDSTVIGEEPVVNSRYSIVIAAAKRARQIIGGDEPMVEAAAGRKPLSVAVQEIYEGKVKIISEDDESGKGDWRKEKMAEVPMKEPLEDSVGDFIGEPAEDPIKDFMESATKDPIEDSIKDFIEEPVDEPSIVPSQESAKEKSNSPC